MAKQQYHFKNLVFEGGGVKGIAYAGALEVLEKKGVLQNIERFAGTSAGAITATLGAVGFSPKEIRQILAETDFNSFKDENLILTKTIRFLLKYGWFKGNVFQEWLESQIAKKYDKNLTFAQLLKSSSKELFIVGTNINKSESVVFSHRSFPEMKISDAVRISMSIPLVFEAIKKEGNVFVDGGLYYNYPINLFDNRRYLFSREHSAPAPYDITAGAVYNKETLGLRVDSIDEIAANKGKMSGKNKPVNSLKEYAAVLLEGLLEMANRVHLHTNDWHRTIFIENPGVKATDFNLSDTMKEKLVDKGKQGAKDYFAWFDNPVKEEIPLNK